MVKLNRHSTAGLSAGPQSPDITPLSVYSGGPVIDPREGAIDVATAIAL